MQLALASYGSKRMQLHQTLLNCGRCRRHRLATEARLRIAELAGLELLAPDESWLGQMAAAPLPPCDPDRPQRRLYEWHRIEVPVWLFGGRPLIRVSFQGYNDERDLDRLLDALGKEVAGSGRTRPA